MHQCVLVPYSEDGDGHTLPPPQPHPAVLGKGDRARQVREQGRMPQGLIERMLTGLTTLPSALSPRVDNAWVSTANVLQLSRLLPRWDWK